MAAATILVALIVALLLWRQPWTNGSAATVHIPDNAGALIAQQMRDLGDADSLNEWSAAAGTTSASRRWATETWDARDIVGLDSVTLRYVTGGEVSDRDDGSTEATVDVTWLADDDAVVPGSHSAKVAVRLDPHEGGLSIRTVRPINGVLPLWLAGQLTSSSEANTTVIRVDGGDETLDVEQLTATARQAVLNVLPDDAAHLAVISPSRGSQMARIVGQEPADIAQIAAVTTRLDADDDVTGVIVLNPDVYATMDSRASQVVLSHEATHVLTGALGRTADTWVVEGFADYIALLDDPASVAESAAQIIAAVRDAGAPTALPDSADFAATGRGLGAVYESAWLIFRTLEKAGGTAAVVDFYRDVIGGSDSEQALGVRFGLTLDQLTQRWQLLLKQLAR